MLTISVSAVLVAILLIVAGAIGIVAAAFFTFFAMLGASKGGILAGFGGGVVAVLSIVGGIVLVLKHLS